MTPQEFEQSLSRASAELQGETMRKLSKVIGYRAVQLFKLNFLDKGSENRTLKIEKEQMVCSGVLSSPIPHRHLTNSPPIHHHQTILQKTFYHQYYNDSQYFTKRNQKTSFD